MRMMLALTVAIGLGGTATAQPVVTSFTGGTGPFSSYYGSASGDVVGYRFTSAVNQFVTHLGIIEDPIDGTLDSAHMIGLWRDSDMTLLAQASVDSSSSLVGGFRYEPITPVLIEAGQIYTLGAMYASGDGDSYWSGPSSITLSNISGTLGVFPSTDNLGFVYPTEESAGNLGRLGPNAIVTSNTAPTASCLESINPSGKKIPPAGSTTLPGSMGGRNEDGFYELVGEDAEDGTAPVFVTNASGSATFGPFSSGTVVKITEAPGATPEARSMGGPDSAVAVHITLDSDAFVFAVDSLGEESSVVSCIVAPPPK